MSSVPQRLDSSESHACSILEFSCREHELTFGDTRDENGRFPNETTPELPPPPVANAQAEIAQFVQSWLAEWDLHCAASPGTCADNGGGKTRR